MINFLAKPKSKATEQLSSELFNEQTFYPAFLKDLNDCLYEAVIESPFITHRRL